VGGVPDLPLFDSRPQLPQLLTASQLAARELDGDAKLRASGLLAESYQLAAILMLKLGESNAAWVAADRGILAAERAEDPLVVASGARILAYAFLGAGHFAKAKELTISAAGVLEPGLGTTSPTHLSLYGALLLKGAMAAAYQGDRITSRALLNEAASTAGRLGADANHYFTAFGPTNVGVHRVSAAVALGDGGVALQHARAVHPVQLPVVERRAQYLVDVARGHGQAGGDDQALRALLTAERLAPEEVRYQPAARALVAELLHREQAGRRPELRALAERVGAVA
jgi:hypothetical protein